jgi:hypothetical protein
MARRPLLLIATTLALAGTQARAGSLLDYVGQCVPFARAASGIQIYGDAWTWWDQAEDRYARGHRPKPGAVIVFERTARLPLGHVAVVSRVVESRVVLLTHANWSRQNGARGHAEQDVTLFDVSPDNDWSRGEGLVPRHRRAGRHRLPCRGLHLWRPPGGRSDRSQP